METVIAFLVETVIPVTAVLCTCLLLMGFGLRLLLRVEVLLKTESRYLRDAEVIAFLVRCSPIPVKLYESSTLQTIKRFFETALFVLRCSLFFSSEEEIFLYKSKRCLGMGWLRLVGSIKLYVSFAEYCLFNRALLQKRRMILSILLTEATPY